jgi:hypothetical protein
MNTLPTQNSNILSLNNRSRSVTLYQTADAESNLVAIATTLVRAPVVYVARVAHRFSKSLRNRRLHINTSTSHRSSPSHSSMRCKIRSSLQQKPQKPQKSRLHINIHRHPPFCKSLRKSRLHINIPPSTKSSNRTEINQ